MGRWEWCLVSSYSSSHSNFVTIANVITPILINDNKCYPYFVGEETKAMAIIQVAGDYKERIFITL